MTTLFLPHLSVARKKNIEPALTCALNHSAEEAAILFRAADWQTREHFACDVRLVRAAQYKAERMAALRQKEHIIEGETPNELIKRFGCNHDLGSGNGCESIGAGYENAEKLFIGLLNSPTHYDHVVGVGWFHQHTLFGIGYATDESAKDDTSQYYHFWCVLTSSC